MCMNKQREEIRKSFPAVINLAQARAILHISKRKASWMLHNGYIPCKNSGKQTRQYQIRLDDLFEYMDKVERGDPSVQIPIGIFNTKPRKINRQETQRLIVPKYYYEQPPEDFQEWLNDEWYDVAEMLTTKDVAEISGYDTTVVQRWMQKKKLRSVLTPSNILITTKNWLVDFYYTEAYKIQNKGATHIELMSKYFSK